MANNIVAVIGAFIIIFSAWIFGGLIGTIIGFMVFIAGAMIGNDYSTAGPNYKLIIMGAALILFATLAIGGPIAVTIGVFLMVGGLFLTTEPQATI